MLTKKEIKEIIPHRDPFLLIDEISELVPGVSAVGWKQLSDDEFYFKGHFPEEPVMPGVMMIESIAQVGAVTLLSKEENRGKIVYFAGIRDAKFRRKVVPGDRLKFTAKITRLKSKFGVGTGFAYVGDEIACEAEFSFILGT